MSEKHPRSRESEEGGVQLPTRRDFLKMATGTVAASTFMFSLTHNEAKAGVSESIEQGDNWNEGLLKLQNEAIHTEKEMVALCVENNSERVWSNDKTSREGQDVLSSQDTSRAVIDINYIRDALNQKPEKLFIAHTHNVSQFTELGMTEEQVRAVRGGEAILPSMPPSVQDLIQSYKVQKGFLQSNIPIVHIAVDPRGTWEFTADLETGFAKARETLDTKTKEHYLIVREDINVKAYRKSNGLYGNKIELFSSIAENDPEEIDEDIRRRAKELRDAFEAFSSYNEKFAQLSKEGVEYSLDSINNKDLRPDKIMAHYKKLGFDVFFTPF